MEQLKIEYVDIDSIKPYKNNAKLHPKEQIEQIKLSIEKFGMDDPIGIWKDEIVEGHGRLIACKELGMTEVPIIRLDHLTDEERKAYTLAHNKLTMNSDFDIDILNDELAKLELKRIASDLASSLLKYQDEKTKMFYQVVNLKDRAGNYPETSGSAMIAYSFLKGARLGVLPNEFKKYGKEIFDGICNNYLEDIDGQLNLGNICLVAGLGPSNNLRRDGSYEYYISEPIVKNEGKGVAPVIMAYIELIRGE